MAILTYIATAGKGAKIRDCNFTMPCKWKIEIGRTLAAKMVRQSSLELTTVGEREPNSYNKFSSATMHTSDGLPYHSSSYCLLESN